MKTALPVLIIMFLPGCALTADRDPIKAVAAGFDTHGEWRNGIHSSILLPKSAKPEEIIRDALNTYRKKNFQFEVLEIRKIKIGHIGSRSEYMAARVKVQSTERVVLFTYEGEKSGWWSKVY